MKSIESARKKELLAEFKDEIAMSKDNYLPRNNNLIARINNLATELGEKPITPGCGPCIVKDAKIIFAALENKRVKRGKDKKPRNADTEDNVE